MLLRRLWLWSSSPGEGQRFNLHPEISVSIRHGENPPKPKPAANAASLVYKCVDASRLSLLLTVNAALSLGQFFYCLNLNLCVAIVSEMRLKHLAPLVCILLYPITGLGIKRQK